VATLDLIIRGHQTPFSKALMNALSSQVASIQFPLKMQCLFIPKRFKVFYGGRSAGRSWGIARFLLLEGSKRKIRVLCCRELQKSITESVHRLLKDQIEALGLDEFYEVQNARIIGANGTTFSFEGLKNNSRKVKSYEGVDYCWIEEANNVSKESWGYLIPTIRKEGSEIILSFNPEWETDYTYQYFVVNPPPESFVVHMTWRDNPGISKETLAEIEHSTLADPDAALNIWEGQTIQITEGAVYAKQLQQVLAEGRVCEVPYFKEVPVQIFMDLGQRNLATAWFIQKVQFEFRVLAYYEARGEDAYHFSKIFKASPYEIGAVYLPHDGKNKTFIMKGSTQEVFQQQGFVTHVAQKTPREAGINAVRSILPMCVFDKTGTAAGFKRLRQYKFRIQNGQYSAEPLHDDNSDAADAFRTFATSMNQRSTGRSQALIDRLSKMPKPSEAFSPSLSWMSR